MIPGVTWSVWTPEKAPKAKCSICGREVKRAVVFPECELGICFGCLDEMKAAVDNEKTEVGT